MIYDIDGEYFVPIRFGVKVGKNTKNSLYVIFDDTKIKKEWELWKGSTLRGELLRCCAPRR